MGKFWRTAIYEPKGRAREYAALACNLYNSCTVGCTYCYCPGVRHMKREDFHAKPVPREGVLDALVKDAAKLRMPSRRILLSFIGDPYQPDADPGLANEAIQIIHEAGHHVSVLTKSLEARAAIQILRHGDQFGVTLTMNRTSESLHWEPRGTAPVYRLGMLERAKDAGIETWASMEPVLDPLQSLAMIRLAAPFVDQFKLGALNYHSRRKEIDWVDYYQRAVDMCQELGKKYFVKEDLRQLAGVANG